MTLKRPICALLVILVTACARAPSRAPPAIRVVSTPAPAIESTPTPPPETAPPESPRAIAPQPDLWQRLRDGMRFARCDAPPGLPSHTLRAPDKIVAQLQSHAPLIDFILRELSARALPSEFALLPMVESDYRALRTRGNRPAGIWQFMPIAAREYSLRVGSEYDMRVDLVQSTRAAARYLADLGQRFDQDWLLANMAFNAGEYRVKRALRAHPQRPPEYAHLGLPGITRAHTARLLALACLVAEPARHGVALAAPSAPALGTLTLRDDLDLALAALLSGVPLEQLAVWNPGSMRQRQPRDTALLLPMAARHRLRAALAQWPPEQRVGWTAWRATGQDDWTELARGSAYDGTALAQLHGSDAPAPIAGSLVALPPNSTRAARVGTHALGADGHYVVRAGDSLWLIARRHGLRVADLLAWNRLSRNAVLRPGQRLRVAAP